jgi:peptidoglycan hydrolase FlgJ
MALSSINTSHLIAPQSNGLAALNAPAEKKADKNQETRDAFDSFVGETFYSQMIKSLHKMQGKPAYFYGGRAEEAFQQQLDQTWSEQMSKANANTFTDSMYNLFSLSKH